MAKSIKQLMDGISTNRDNIGQVFGLMGLKDDNDNPVGHGSTLAQLAEAAGNIAIDETVDGERVLDASSDAVSIGGGRYFPNRVEVKYYRDDQYDNGVYPKSTDETYPAADRKLITSFKVKKVPISNPTINLTDIIGDGTDENITHKVTPSQQTIDGALRDQYFDEVNIPKVMLGEYDVKYSEVFNPTRTQEIVIDKTDLTKSSGQTFDWSGVSKVTIPKPNPTSYTQTCDFYETDITVDAEGNAQDIEIDLNAGFISKSTISVEITELYKDLAAI